MLKTTDVFTPNTSSPKLSKVDRTEIEDKLADSLDEGGRYIFVQGVTKLGKTTLVRSAVQEVDRSFWFDSQNLRGGAEALWAALASQLRQPIEEAFTSHKTDTSKWNFLGSIGFFALNGGGEHALGWAKSRVIAVDLPHTVPEALQALREAGESIAIVLDDFHFIDDQQTRMEILQALKPVADRGVTIIVVTLPYRDNFQAFTKSNIGGRSGVLEIPSWSPKELSEIAETGFKELNVWADDATVVLLAENSFGSPQVMQSLCLLLCRNINGYRKRQEELTKLHMPATPEEVFKRIHDQNALNWLKHLAGGPTPRGKRRKGYPIDGGMELDAYTLILHSLRNLGPKPRTTLTELKTEIGQLRGVSPTEVTKMNLNQILRPMTLLALMDMQAKLKEVDESQMDLGVEDIFDGTELPEVPQPVFEWSKDETSSPINILDPLLLYTLRWHWPDVLAALSVEADDDSNIE